MADLGEFVIGVAKEIVRFTLRVEDFFITLDSGVPSNPSMEFDIGESIGLPSKWKMEITSEEYLAQKMVQLCVFQISGESEVKHFSCTATVGKSPTPLKLNTNFPSVKLNTSFIMNNADDLVIHVTFALCSPTFVTTKGNDTLLGGVDVLDNYGDLLNTGDNSDFVIKVKRLDGEYEEIRVHKAILSARSSFFKTMLNAQMQERESETWTIEDLSPECVKIMLKYIYTGNLDADWEDVPQEMVRAADKYNLPILLDFLNRQLHRVCSVDNALKLWELSGLHKLHIAQRNINKFIGSNLDSILR